MIRTIFVPLEISNSDEVIIRYAIELSKHFKSRLVFLKTFLPAEYAYPTSGMASIPATQEALVLERKELHTEKINYLKSEFPSLESLEFELKVFSGSPLDLINETAEESNSDLIVIGTSGASGIGELFGTIAEKVTRESSCPVMVIPDEFEFRPFQKMSLALDVDNVENRLHLNTLFHIANSFTSSLDVVNVSENLEKADINHNMIYNRIKNEFNENVNYFTIRILLKEDEEKAIDEYIERNNIEIFINCFFLVLFQ